MSGRLNFEYGFSTNIGQPIAQSCPMRIYFLGDYTGDITKSGNSLANKIIKIDIDNFDDVMMKLSPSISLPSGHLLTFGELEDFHPDNLFDHTIFESLRRLKRELGNSATTENAADEIMKNYQLDTEKRLQRTDDEPDSNSQIAENKITKNSGDMFERLLGKKQSPPLSNSPNTNFPDQISAIVNIDRFLGDLLSPHIIKDTKPEHNNLMILIDTAIEQLMKSIIHSDEFQSLESVWRSVREVLFNETYDEANHFFYLVNTDRNALTRAVTGDNDFVTQLNQHIKNTDIDCYDILIGNYQFSTTNDDITAMNYLACIAETLKCQFIAAADNSLINENEDSLWQQFRKTPQARHLTLSYPRVLLRVPYGKKHDEVDTFPFEEFSQLHQHNKLLWGNSAFACARLLIRRYHIEVNSQKRGQATIDTNITELPAFVYSANDEKKLQACGEHLLSESQLIDIRDKGIVVFASFRNQNSIRLFGGDIYAVNG